ncbi:MAG: MMPL family transporter [Bdellovibrionales bacterium]|nr:MMPL family transporter [Bdellovibrionales bacterium]
MSTSKKLWLFVRKATFLLASIAFILGALKLAQDRLPFSVADMLKEGSVEREKYLRYDSIFGNEATFSILFETQNQIVAMQEISSFLKEVHYELQTNKSVKSLASLKDAEFVEFKKHHVFLNLFLDEEGKVKPEAVPHLEGRFWKNTLVTEDRKSLLVLGSFSEASLFNDERYTVERLEESLKNLEERFPQWKSHLIGTNVVQYYLFKDIVLTQRFITPMLLGLLGLLIYVLYRSFAILALTLGTLLLSYASTIYFVYSVDGGISAFTGFAIFFVLIVGTSDLIHFFSSFVRISEPDLNKKLDLVKKSIMTPCFFTSLTTVFGFSSLLLSDLVPIIKVGLYSSFGSIACFLVTFFVLPYLIKVYNINIYSPEVLKKLDVRKYVGWTLRHAKFSLMLASAITLVFLFGLGKLHIDDRFYNKFSDSHKLTAAVDRFTQSFHFLDSIEMVLKPRQGDPIGPENFTDIASFEEEIQAMSEITSMKSHARFYDYIRERGRKDLFPLGLSEERVQSRVDSFYQKIVDIGVLEDFYDKDRGIVRAIAFLGSPSFQTVKRVKENIESIYRDRYSDKFDLDFMGHAFIRAYVNEGIIRGILKSLGAGLVLTFIAFRFVFRDFKLSLLAMIPNILPLLFIGGFMGLFSVDVESNLVLMVCITLGISVDDTIHFIYSFQRHRRNWSSLESAVLHTLDDTSGALVGTTMVFVLSFPCFFLAEVKLYVQAGIYVILSLLVALVADLFLLPVLMKVFEERKTVHRVSAEPDLVASLFD